MIRIGAKVPNSGPLPGERGIATMARRLEEAGFASLWVSDHVVQPGTIESRYPFAADGRATWSTDDPWYDAIVAMSTIAAVTTTAEVGVAVLVLPLRQPVVLAKQIASIDALSGGRTVLGLGAGWLAEEFTALDVPFDERGSRTDEWMTLLRTCWTGRPAAFEGRHYQLPADVRCFPTPTRTPPLLVGGTSRAALRRAGRNGDGWLAIQDASALDPGEVAAGIALVRGAAADAGKAADATRIAFRIVGSAGRVDTVAQRLGDFAAAGVTDVIVDADWSADGGPERAAAVLSEARDLVA